MVLGCRVWVKKIKQSVRGLSDLEVTKRETTALTVDAVRGGILDPLDSSRKADPLCPSRPGSTRPCIGPPDHVEQGRLGVRRALLSWWPDVRPSPMLAANLRCAKLDEALLT